MKQSSILREGLYSEMHEVALEPRLLVKSSKDNFATLISTWSLTRVKGYRWIVKVHVKFMFKIVTDLGKLKEGQLQLISPNLCLQKGI